MSSNKTNGDKSVRGLASIYEGIQGTWIELFLIYVAAQELGSMIYGFDPIVFFQTALVEIEERCHRNV